MADDPLNRLSQIATEWSLLQQAHASQTLEARPAQERLLARYGGAVKRYLLGCLRDADAADEAYQDFALRFITGKLHGAAPERGRFRPFLMGVLSHLVADQHRLRHKQPLGMNSETPEPAAEGWGPNDDAAFLAGWREELLSKAWSLLEEHERRSGQPFHSTLAHRRDHPDQRSEEMATALSARLGKPISAASVRQTLHRAREKFADLLLEQVAHSLDVVTQDELAQELAELNLLSYCQSALDRRQAKE